MAKVEKTGIPLSKVRYEQMRAVAAADSQSPTQWIDQRISDAFKQHFPNAAPIGFVAKVIRRNDEKPFLIFGHEDVGTVELDLEEAAALARGAFKMLDKRRDFTSVNSRDGQHVWIRRTGANQIGYAIYFTHGGKDQKSIGVYAHVLRDLMSVILDLSH